LVIELVPRITQGIRDGDVRAEVVHSGERLQRGKIGNIVAHRILPSRLTTAAWLM
jgi:hypothetical protein